VCDPRRATFVRGANRSSTRLAEVEYAAYVGIADDVEGVRGGTSAVAALGERLHWLSSRNRFD
jgi:hypothetical protein